MTCVKMEKKWGGENRRVYRWDFNPIVVPYLKVSGDKCQESQNLKPEHLYETRPSEVSFSIKLGACTQRRG